MRGFLKSREGIFQLASNTTTIGREGCDLLLSVSIYPKGYFDIGTVCIFAFFVKMGWWGDFIHCQVPTEGSAVHFFIA